MPIPKVANVKNGIATLRNGIIAYSITKAAAECDVTSAAICYAIKEETIPKEFIIMHEGKRYLRWPESKDRYLKEAKRAKKAASKSPSSEGDSFSAASSRKLNAQTQLLELKLANEAELLIPKELILEAWNDISINVQQAMLAIPDRVASILINEPDSHKIHLLLTKEIRHALTNLEWDVKDPTKIVDTVSEEMDEAIDEV
jgi:hypothetical protein